MVLKTSELSLLLMRTLKRIVAAADVELLMLTMTTSTKIPADDDVDDVKNTALLVVLMTPKIRVDAAGDKMDKWTRCCCC